LNGFTKLWEGNNVSIFLNKIYSSIVSKLLFLRNKLNGGILISFVGNIGCFGRLGFFRLSRSGTQINVADCFSSGLVFLYEKTCIGFNKRVGRGKYPEEGFPAGIFLS